MATKKISIDVDESVIKSLGQRFPDLPDKEKVAASGCPIAIKEFVGKWYVSPTLEYDFFRCTACGKDIFECSHLPGQEINGVSVRYQRQNLHITSASLVEIPEDPRCRIEWLSLPKDRFRARSEGNGELRCFICQRTEQESKEDLSDNLESVP